jgi:ribA/ribD-fused uncharacterized protein
MHTEPLDVDQLREAVRGGARLEYLFFWGHTGKGGGLGKECLSQWYPAPFEVDGKRYTTAEHFMMAGKARLFGDAGAEAAILRAKGPDAAKKLGRKVTGFDEAKWVAHRFEIVVEGNVAKFAQSPDLREYLLGTGTAVLVEASPMDRIWGIGLAQDNPLAADPASWRGLNLLGFALMKARSRLRGQAV